MKILGMLIVASLLFVVAPAPAQAQAFPCDLSTLSYYDNEPPAKRSDVFTQDAGEFFELTPGRFRPALLRPWNGSTVRYTPSSTSLPTREVRISTGIYADAIQFDFDALTWPLTFSVLDMAGNVLHTEQRTQAGTFSWYQPAVNPADFMRRVLLQGPNDVYTDNLYVGTCTPVAVDLVIDVQPEQINCNSALFPTWILGQDGIDLTTVDKETLLVNGVQESHWSKKEEAPKIHFDDVNSDTLIDIVFHVDTTGAISECPLEGETVEATVGMTGMLGDGTLIQGEETVLVFGNQPNE